MKRITYLLFMLCLSLWSLHAMGQTIKVDEFIYSVNKDGEHTLTLLQIPKNAENVVIPANVNYGGADYTVTRVSGESVSYNSSLKTVSIPATVIKISDQMYAFEDCDLLESITVDEGNESYFSQDGAIYDKNTLALLRLPKCVRGKVTLVDGMTDSYGSKRLDLEKMPNVEEIVFAGGLESISMNGMASLKSATFPSSVSSLDIKECPVLDKVSVYSGGVYSSTNNVIYKNTEVYHNDGYVKGREIVFLPQTRTEYVMPSDVVSIPDQLFVTRDNLVSLSVEASNVIFESEGNAIYEEVQGIEGRFLVDVAGGLTELVLPSNLGGIKGTNVEDADDDSFEPRQGVPVMYAMKKLASISMPVPNENYMTVDGVLLRMLTDMDVHEGELGWCVDCVPPAIEGKVVLPEGVVDVTSLAFYGTGITSVTIPDGCMVSYAAFANCKSLSEVIFTGDASAESTAFYGTPWLINHEPGVLYAGTTAIGLAGTPKEIVIKEGTKTIGKEAFTPFGGRDMSVGGASLEKVTLPEGLEKIERFAFLDCGNLKSVNIPSTLKIIEYDAFEHCPLTEITLGEGLTFMPDIFSDANIKNVYVPASVEKWEATSFSDDLESIEVSPDNKVFASQGGILYDKDKTAVLMVPPAMVNAEIPEGCVSIGMAPVALAKPAVKASAYEDMPNVRFGEKLETISLPSTLQNIYGYDVFTNCSELKECRVFNSTPIEIGEYTFPYDLSGVKLYVPKGSEDAYRNAAEWNRFEIIEGFDTTGIGDSAVSEKPYETSRYSLDGRRLQAPEKGVNIVRMSDGSVHKVVVK